MRTLRLRTKFLLSLLAISSGLTSATLLIVGYSVQKGVRSSLAQDLQSSVRTYESFAQQREAAMSRTAKLLANLPNVAALMTTGDVATIQDGAEGIFELSGADLLVLADGSGRVEGLRGRGETLDWGDAQELMKRSLERGEAQAWWFRAGKLYEVWMEPIYFGKTQTVLGLVAIGEAIDQKVAQELSGVASSEVAFRIGNTLVASTFAGRPGEQMEKLAGSADEGGQAREMELGRERYLTATVRISAADDEPVFLTVFKSFDKASAFLKELNGILTGLGILSIFAGSALVFLISDTFTRPLGKLVEGVRALEKGDFEYPLEGGGGDEAGELTEAFVRMRTSLRAALENQQQMETRLRQAHKMEAVGRLAGGVAHDFNNLLTIIRGHSDLLMDRVESEGAIRRSTEQIRKAADRAAGLTRQLLAFSRMQVLQPRILDLNSVVAEMGKMLPRLIGEHIEYVFRPGANLGRIKADPGQIEQVIMNLAVNARDAMPQGGSLTITTRNAAVSAEEAAVRPPMTAGDYVLLSVADTGHGMDEATKTHIFEPFFTTKEVGKGTGLGLATVYGVVKQSGGFIWVESAPGRGAQFDIYLPRAEEDSAEPAGMEEKAVRRGTETILVVEDEQSVRELACEFLRCSGYSVMEAGNGTEALAILGKQGARVDLVLSDVMMPKMTGATLMEKLKTILPDTPVLLMSGYAEYAGTPDSVRQAAVIQKPFTLASLLEAVRDALDRKIVREAASVSGPGGGLRT